MNLKTVRMYISVTYMKLLSWPDYLNRWWHEFKLAKTVRKLNGLKTLSTNSRFPHFYTLTAWQSKDEMEQYEKEVLQKEIMNGCYNSAGVLKSVCWKASDIPDWNEIKNRISSATPYL